MALTKESVTPDSIIGDVIKEVPGAEAVIARHFGNGCFTCPGINVEPLSFGAMMHNIDINTILEEIRNLEG